MRWLDPVPPLDKDQTRLTGVLSEAFVTFDLDNDSTKGNETDYDMSLRGAGGPGVPYQNFVHKYPGLKGQSQVRSSAFSGTTGDGSTNSSTCRTRKVTTPSSRQDGRLSTSCLMKMTTIIVGNVSRCITRCMVSVDQKTSTSIQRSAGDAATMREQAMVAEDEKPGLVWSSTSGFTRRPRRV